MNVILIFTLIFFALVSAICGFISLNKEFDGRRLIKGMNYIDFAGLFVVFLFIAVFCLCYEFTFGSMAGLDEGCIYRNFSGCCRGFEKGN